jgi:hypothetical protein
MAISEKKFGVKFVSEKASIELPVIFIIWSLALSLAQ